MKDSGADLVKFCPRATSTKTRIETAGGRGIEGVGVQSEGDFHENKD